MAMTFYPHQDELTSSTPDQKLEVLFESAERYKAFVLEMKAPEVSSTEPKKRLVPRDIPYAYNWEDIAALMREIRELPEASPTNKSTKAARLTKLAEIYEVLRGAKMPKLEAVRLALMNEANQLRSGSSQVA